MSARRPVVLALLSAVVLASVPAFSADDAPVRQWETVADTGALGDDIARFTTASPTLNMVNQGLDTVFVSGTSMKPRAVQGVLNDLDVGTTAYDANTGSPRWHATFDSGPGVDDQLAAFEANYHNNLVYEVVNAGPDMVTIERGVSDGKLSRSATLAGAQGADAATSSEGGFLGVVGRKGADFLALTYETGSQDLEFAATPVAGHANATDISRTGSLDAIRTLVATGQSSGFGTGGDLYTVAYNYRTHAKLWERSWASPNNRADEGMAVASASVKALGRAVAFVAARTFTPERGWDVLVTAYDLANGNPLWTQRYDGPTGGDDLPLYVAYSDAASTLFVVGTTERGAPHGQDVLGLAFDAATGRPTATAFGGGTTANGDDKPTGVVLSKDGKRLFVAADVVNQVPTPRRQAAVFGYDTRLRSSGVAATGASSDDRSAGVAMNVAQDRVFLAGSTQTTTGYDHRVSSFDVASFPLPPVEIPTALSLTVPASGQYGDTVPVAARLTDSSGAAVAGQPVTLGLAGQQATVTTDSTGVAQATFRLEIAPGSSAATAHFAGAGLLLPSDATAAFAVVRETTATTLAVTGSGVRRVLTARLTDGDDATAGLAGREIVFTADGATLGRATTGADGSAGFAVPAGYRGGAHTYAASFAGDTYYEASRAQAVTT
jgi:hypothetical protein